MGLLTDVVRSGVFGDHLLAATRRTLYEHRIIIPGRRRLSELAGEAATTVERHALEVIEREIPAATRAQWSAALSQSIGDTHCEFSENPSFFALRTSLKKQELSPRAADTAVRLPDDIFEEKSGQLQGNLTTPKGFLAKSVVRARGHARLDLDGDRGWRRTVDAHSPRTMASDQWLVRFSFRPLRLSVTAWVLRRYAGLTVGWALPVAAAACFIAGRIALMLGRGSNG